MDIIWQLQSPTPYVKGLVPDPLKGTGCKRPKKGACWIEVRQDIQRWFIEPPI